MDVAAIRAKAAQVVWLICLACALLLIVGALLIALDANGKNELVRFVKGAADNVDLGFFDRQNGILKFDEGSPRSRVVKNALVNWGLGGVVWLIIGRVASRLVRG
ncbi:hypothetical protein K8W59_10900 [Nocardioides rotundus]|nr:hypothetical protein K8W59_10900 [Nocardioides rotundus]